MSEIDQQRRDWAIAGAGLLAVVVIMAIGVWRQATQAAQPKPVAHNAAAPSARRAAAPITQTIDVRDVPEAGRRAK
jgi:hypothetical protein